MDGHYLAEGMLKDDTQFLTRRKKMKEESGTATLEVFSDYI
jgi:hypothetical protein